jgi:hypothetical protein
LIFTDEEGAETSLRKERPTSSQVADFTAASDRDAGGFPQGCDESQEKLTTAAASLVKCAPWVDVTPL